MKLGRQMYRNKVNFSKSRSAEGRHLPSPDLDLEDCIATDIKYKENKLQPKSAEHTLTISNRNIKIEELKQGIVLF